MRKVLLSILTIIFIGTFLNAQITVTDSNIASIGDVIYEAEDTIPNTNIVPGGTGEQNWDFSNLAIHTVETQEFLDPSTTPNGADFASSNLCFHSVTEGTYAYVTKSTASLIIDGMAAVLPGETELTSITKDPTELIIEYPLNLGDNVIDSSFMEIELGDYRMLSSLTKTYDADAWGNVSIPLGTYEAIRVSRTNIETQDIQMNVMGNWTSIQYSVDTTYSYEWWTNNSGIKLTICSIGSVN